MLKYTISWIKSYLIYSIKSKIVNIDRKKNLLNKKYEDILFKLNADGACVINIYELENKYTETMISTAKKLMYDISGQSCPSDSFKIQVQDKSMDEYPEIIKWGLSENLIGLIEEYIKGKIKYLYHINLSYILIFDILF